MGSTALEGAPTVAGSAAESRRDGGPAGLLDLAGLALLAAAVGWTYASAGASDGDPGPVAGLFLGCAAAAIAGRLVGAASRTVGAAVLVAAALVPAWGSLGRMIDLPRMDPFGYSNATGAFFVQATCGALVLAAAARHGFARIAGIVLAVGFAALTVRTRSAAGVILLALPVAAIAARSREAVQRAAVGAAGLIVAALVAAVLLAALQPALEGTSPLSRAVDATLSHRRPALWRDAIRIMAEQPLTGAGPGRFDAERRVASSDQDVRWAHNGFLQQGAEQGVPGLALLLLAFIWAAARLRAAAAGGLVAALGAASLASLAIHANVDYVLHFPAVPIAAAALFGIATAVPRVTAVETGPMRVTGLTRKAAKVVALPMGLGARTRSGDLVVLLYHRVGAGNREIDVDTWAFRRHLTYLATAGVVRSLEEALGTDEGGVVVTIDDGYRDFHESALPVFAEQRVPALLYLATGLVANGGPSGPEALSWHHLEEAVATGLVAVGSHTHSHADLSTATEREAEEEMRRSKGLIEDRLGVACRHFAYPWGMASPPAERAARRLFETAALPWQTNRRGAIDPYRLGRTPVLRNDGMVFFRAKVHGMLDGEALLYRVLRRGPWRRA